MTLAAPPPRSGKLHFFYPSLPTKVDKISFFDLGQTSDFLFPKSLSPSQTKIKPFLGHPVILIFPVYYCIMLSNRFREILLARHRALRRTPDVTRVRGRLDQ